jgi:lipopolysaccharide heptosyltransferase III
VTLIRTNCRHYRISLPCAPHKATGTRCDECGLYDPVAERVLIVKLDAIGDVLRTTTCLEPLKAKYPNSHITWITRSRAADVLRGNALIDRVLTVESNYLEFILAEDFDLAIGPDTDHLSATIMRLARASSRRGFIGDGRGGVIPLNDAARQWWEMGLDDLLKRQNRRTYGEWLYDICELPPPVARPSLQPSEHGSAAARRLIRARAPNASQVVCFNTGGSSRWEQKRWKQDSYRQLALAIRAADPAAAIILTGGPEEAAFNAALLASNAPFVDGGTDNAIDAFAGLIAASDVVVTPDSLGYHIACAVGTPAICLVGPTSPWELDTYDTNRVLHADLECISCYLARCPLATTCMDALTPPMVLPVVSEVRAQRHRC